MPEEDGIPFPLKTGDDEPEDGEDKLDGGGEPEDDNDGPEKLISQKELDRIVQKRLQRQEQQLSKKYADYDTLLTKATEYDKLQDEKATDAERWDRERNQLIADRDADREELTKLQRVTLVADLASERGLAKKFWKRVSGDTEEDIAEDIDSIIHDLGADQGDSKEDTPKASQKKRGSVYGGGGENEDPDPDTNSIVAAVPRGPQFRIEKPRTYK